MARDASAFRGVPLLPGYAPVKASAATQHSRCVRCLTRSNNWPAGRPASSSLPACPNIRWRTRRCDVVLVFLAYSSSTPILAPGTTGPNVPCVRVCERVARARAPLSCDAWYCDRRGEQEVRRRRSDVCVCEREIGVLVAHLSLPWLILHRVDVASRRPCLCWRGSISSRHYVKNGAGGRCAVRLCGGSYGQRELVMRHWYSLLLHHIAYLVGTLSLLGPCPDKEM